MQCREPNSFIEIFQLIEDWIIDNKIKFFFGSFLLGLFMSWLSESNCEIKQDQDHVLDLKGFTESMAIDELEFFISYHRIVKKFDELHILTGWDGFFFLSKEPEIQSPLKEFLQQKGIKHRIPFW